MSIGGKDSTIEENQLNVFRFANRIPLLFEQGNDVITRTAQAMKWNKYKISLDQGVGVFVSIVSTKIPFKGTSKEYIGESGELSFGHRCSHSYHFPDSNPANHDPIRLLISLRIR